MEIKKDMTVELFDSELYLTKCYDTSYTAEQMKKYLNENEHALDEFDEDTKKLLYELIEENMNRKTRCFSLATVQNCYDNLSITFTYGDENSKVEGYVEAIIGLQYKGTVTYYID